MGHPVQKIFENLYLYLPLLYFCIREIDSRRPLWHIECLDIFAWIFAIYFTVPQSVLCVRCSLCVHKRFVWMVCLTLHYFPLRNESNLPVLRIKFSLLSYRFSFLRLEEFHSFAILSKPFSNVFWTMPNSYFSEIRCKLCCISFQVSSNILTT